MARYNLQFPFESYRGRVGGATYSANKAGNYIKAFESPANPNTKLQQIIRGLFTDVAKEWFTLTPAQRSFWETYANTDYVPLTTESKYTGRQAYTALRICQTYPYRWRDEVGLTAYSLQLGSQGVTITLADPEPLEIPPTPWAGSKKFNLNQLELTVIDWQIEQYLQMNGSYQVFLGVKIDPTNISQGLYEFNNGGKRFAFNLYLSDRLVANGQKVMNPFATKYVPYIPIDSINLAQNLTGVEYVTQYLQFESAEDYPPRLGWYLATLTIVTPWGEQRILDKKYIELTLNT